MYINMKKLWLPVILLILMVLPVCAELPRTDSFIAERGDGYFTIFNTQSLTFKKAETINFTFSVVDYWFSLKQDNNSVNCSFWAISNNGKIVAYGNASYDTASQIWYYPLTSSQLTPTGTYDWKVYCYNSTHAGIVSSVYVITENGENEGNVDLGVVVYFLFIIAMFIILGVANKFAYFKWGCFVYAFYESILFLGFVYAYLSSLDLLWLFRLNLYMTLIVGFMIVILSLMFRSIDLMGYGTESEKSQLGMDRFQGSKFDGGKNL